MSALTSVTPAASYKDLLQVSNSNAGVDTTERRVSDGEATDSALAVSTTLVGVWGDLLLGGDTGAQQTRTNSTVKTSYVTAPHYTNSEEAIHYVACYSQSSVTTLYVGGGLSGLYNAATSIIFATATSNTTTQGTERGQIDNAGNFVWGTAAIATNASGGFVYIPSCAGAATGTPSTYTGRVPMVVDTSNLRLYFYISGTWRYAALT